MYLKGSKWSMNRRRKPINYFGIAVLLILIAIMLYVQQMIIPTVETPFRPTPTATRPPEAYISEADQLFKEGKLTQAIDSYQQAIKANPGDATIYVALAQVQIFAGKPADAKISAENAILLSPNNSMAHAVHGWALDFLGDYILAEASVQRALEFDPNNAKARAYYAEILIDQYISGTGPLDVLDRASAESKAALELGPNTVEAHRARGYVLEATQNYQEALREYQAAAAINDNIADVHLHIGYNYSALGLTTEAVTALTRADTLNPADPTPDIVIARIYARLGEYPRAIQYADQAIQNEPTNASFYGTKGVLLYRNFQWPEAEAALSLAVRGGGTADGTPILPVELTTESRIVEFYWTYGLVLVRLGKCGDALPIFRQVRERAPNDEIAIASVAEGEKICAESIGSFTPEPTADRTAAPTP
jgi:tetratricopeptide (TPR) repeat protein